MIVRLERTIRAAPHAVYRAWLDPEVVPRWLAPGDLTVTLVEIDERPGGRYRIRQADAGRDVGGVAPTAFGSASAGSSPASTARCASSTKLPRMVT